LITGIVLAAGASSRLGRPKQLLDLAGKPLLQHVVDAAQSARLDEIIVVLGHAAPTVARAVTLPAAARFVINLDHAQGQSTSLRAGLKAADARSAAGVILLGDQPGIRPDAVASVVEAWRGGQHPVVQASYSATPAHPTLLDRSVWIEIEGVTGDQGARAILPAHPGWLRLVEVGGDPPDDIDTEEDYSRIRKAFSRNGPAIV
jgi:molybdenum cofactor cytidylyltransferase